MHWAAFSRDNLNQLNVLHLAVVLGPSEDQRAESPTVAMMIIYVQTWIV